MQPFIGMMVHYVSLGSANGQYKPERRAAIVTQIHWDTVDAEGSEGFPQVGLCVLNPTGMFFNEYVAYSSEPLPGCWTWADTTGRNMMMQSRGNEDPTDVPDYNRPLTPKGEWTHDPSKVIDQWEEDPTRYPGNLGFGSNKEEEAFYERLRDHNAVAAFAPEDQIKVDPVHMPGAFVPVSREDVEQWERDDEEVDPDHDRSWPPKTIETKDD